MTSLRLILVALFAVIITLSYAAPKTLVVDEDEHGTAGPRLTLDEATTRGRPAVQMTGQAKPAPAPPPPPVPAPQTESPPPMPKQQLVDKADQIAEQDCRDRIRFTTNAIGQFLWDTINGSKGHVRLVFIPWPLNDTKCYDGRDRPSIVAARLCDASIGYYVYCEPYRADPPQETPDANGLPRGSLLMRVYLVAPPTIDGAPPPPCGCVLSNATRA